jgi:hypothetical protein
MISMLWRCVKWGSNFKKSKFLLSSFLEDHFYVLSQQTLRLSFCWFRHWLAGSRNAIGATYGTYPAQAKNRRSMESGTRSYHATKTASIFCRHEKETNLCVDVEAGQSRRRIQRRGAEACTGASICWCWPAGDWGLVPRNMQRHRTGQREVGATGGPRSSMSLLGFFFLSIRVLSFQSLDS